MPRQPAQNEETSPRGKPVVPDHEVLRVIGQGAYGEVWLGLNILGEYRAVKVVWRQKFAGEDRPFEREFEGIKRFEPVSRSHPSQLAILHVGKNEELGYFYYVMELADDASAECGVRNAEGAGQNSSLPPEGGVPQPTGTPPSGGSVGARRNLCARNAELNENAQAAPRQFGPIAPDSYVPKTLRRVLRDRGALPAEECLEISLALTAALAHLHGQGLVHRDIKPSNVIFVQGVPKLADIGLVAAVDDTCSFVGTAGYMPPEGPGSPQADVYSLGKVLYEMLTGRDRQEFPALPQEFGRNGGDSRSDTAANNVFRGTPERTLTAELNQVVLAACESDCRLRYPYAQAMHDDLALLKTGRSVKRKRAFGRRWKLAKRIVLTGMAVAVAGASATFALRELNRSRPLSSNPEALELYQQAQYIGQSFTLERTLQAYTNLTKAVELDPRFVDAYFGLFDINAGPWGDRLPPHYERVANWKWVADKIHEIRPNSAQYHIVHSMITFSEWHFYQAIHEMKLALKLDPKCRCHGLYGWMILRAWGDAPGARAEWQTAKRIGGSDTVPQSHLGSTYYVERNFKKAIEEYRKAVRLEPRATVAYDLLGRAYEAGGQYDKALDQFEAMEKLLNTDATDIEARYNRYRAALAKDGPPGMWQAMLEDCRQRPSPDPFDMAKLCARLGRTDEVFSWLEQARLHHDENMMMLLMDDWWDPLRDDPRFKQLLAKVGFSKAIIARR